MAGEAVVTYEPSRVAQSLNSDRESKLRKIYRVSKGGTKWVMGFVLVSIGGLSALTEGASTLQFTLSLGSMYGGIKLMQSGDEDLMRGKKK